jgi:hypothetical protein
MQGQPCSPLLTEGLWGKFVEETQYDGRLDSLVVDSVSNLAYSIREQSGFVSTFNYELTGFSLTLCSPN